MRLHIVGPAPHQLTHGLDEDGNLWAMTILYEGTQTCKECGQPTSSGYMRVKDKALVCFEHVERMEPAGTHSGFDLFRSHA